MKCCDGNDSKGVGGAVWPADGEKGDWGDEGDEEDDGDSEGEGESEGKGSWIEALEMSFEWETLLLLALARGSTKLGSVVIPLK